MSAHRRSHRERNLIESAERLVPVGAYIWVRTCLVSIVSVMKCLNSRLRLTDILQDHYQQWCPSLPNHMKSQSEVLPPWSLHEADDTIEGDRTLEALHTFHRTSFRYLRILAMLRYSSKQEPIQIDTCCTGLFSPNARGSSKQVQVRNGLGLQLQTEGLFRE